MKAGRELDALVADKIMGLKVYGQFHENDRGVRIHVPRYSTNIEDAWKVVEKMENTHRFSLHRTVKENGWQVIFWDIETDAHRSLVAETAPLAICLAALRCKGIDIDGNN